jgi:hypothetical protein
MTTSSIATFTFPAHFHRTQPDPTGNKEQKRHTFYVALKDFPRDLPLDPNARTPNINHGIYKDILRSALSNDGLFHLKHKGITLVAEEVKPRDEKGPVTTLSIRMRDLDGILDGGHSSEIIGRVQDISAEDGVPIGRQFVKVDVVTRVPFDDIMEMSKGLNTSVQVKEISLENLAGHFDWLKKLLADTDYSNLIGWQENAKCELDARDLVSVLACFNLKHFPADVDAIQPVIAYEKKSKVLELYQNDRESFEQLAPIVKDILYLYDAIRSEREAWNEEGGKFGGLAFVEKKEKGFFLPFIGETVTYRLMDSVVFPMLAGFRCMVTAKRGKYAWKGSFDQVLDLWKESSVGLLRLTKQVSDEHGRNPNAIGKSRPHWSNVLTRVQLKMK